MLKNDLKNDIEKTLQAHCPEPPEGFAERMDKKAISLIQKKHNQNVKKAKSRFRLPVLAAAAVLALCFVTATTRDLIIRPDEIRARETTTPLVTAMSEGHGEVTEGAGLSPEAIKTLEATYPGLINELKPVNLSNEQQGVRFDLVSAVIKNRDFYIVYAIQDLEGDRVKANLSTDYHDHFGADDHPQDIMRLNYDEAEHKGEYVRKYKMPEAIHTTGEVVVMSFQDLWTSEHSTVDLLPLLEQYGKTEKSVALPEDLNIQPYDPRDTSTNYSCVLDYTQPLDETLYGPVKLTGIGWIDNKLHVQVYNQDTSVISIGRDYSPSWKIWLGSHITDQEGNRFVDYNTLSWGYSDEKEPVWHEYVWDISPDEKSQMDLSVAVEHITKTLEAKWEFQVPVDSIVAGNSVKPSANIQNESDKQIEATLWGFFIDWVAQDTESLLALCADEWKNDRLDPTQAIQKIMGYWGQPAGYKINGISGKDNDPVRTVDLTVQWKTEDGGYTYNRHEIACKLQKITPAMEAYQIDPTGFDTGIDVETVPGKELVLLTEEEIIRKAISYPELSYDDLIPINLSMEKQGIRMEVISGCVKGQELYILCSVQELEGRYVGLDMEIDQLFKPEVLRMGYSRPYSNYAENKSFWLFHTDEFTQYQAEDGTIPFGIDLVKFENDISVDLIPFLEKYGKESEGVNAPENARAFGDKESAEGLKILDYTNPLDVSLAETATLTGIGWIDNQLHIQLHTATDNIHTESGTSFPATSVHVYDPFSSQSGQVVEWDENGDWFPEWYDYALDIKPENIEQQWLIAEVRETKGVVEVDWEIPIPVNTLLKETGEETTAQEGASAAIDAYNEYELKEKFNECLWWFFRNWALGNTESVTAAFEHEWNTEQADPEESAKEIMKSGTPGGYKIHSVSGKLGDADCKADVTVLWQEGESSYTCTRHELEFWLEKDENGDLQYAINPEGFKNGSAVESFPDNPVLMRESDIIREVMEAHIEEVSYDELLPIGLSTEKQGIRMDVVSGCRKGDNVYLLLTTQDLNGKYSEYEIHPSFVYEQEDDVWDGYELRLILNRAEGKTTWLYRMDLSKEPLTENNTLRAGIKQLSFSERKEIDLLPMLKEYGKTQEGVTPPKESLCFTLDGKPMENKWKALNYEESLDVHLDGNVFLSAIGWIDNQLHVQFQNKSWALMQQEYPDIPYDNYMMAVNCYVKDKTYEEIRVDDSRMSWRETYEGPSWEESVFNCTPEDLDRMELYATETISKGVLDDDWTVEIPMEMFPGETSEKTAVQKEKPAEPATLSNEGEVFLEYAYPGLLNELKPVNLSSVQQGIRADIISALIKDQKLYVVFSLQDLEGDRIKENPVISCLHNLSGGSESTMRLGYNELNEHHRVTYLKTFDLSDPVQAGGRIKLNIDGLDAEKRYEVDLLPLLKKYGKTVEGVNTPEDVWIMPYDLRTSSTVDASKYPTILDYEHPLDETLKGTISLTGIGWIDNRLHVQIHNTDNTIIIFGGTIYPSTWMISPRCAVMDGKDYGCDILSWDSVGGWQAAWQEYVWEITPDDTDHLELKADVTHFENILDAQWNFELPVDSILANTEAKPAAHEAETEKAQESLSLEEKVNRQIEERWPGILKELKPVNKSCEKQGIRFEVTSALVKGNEAWAVYTLEDITGDRGSPEEGYCVGGYEKDTEGKEPKTETYLLQRAGETGRRQIYVKHIEAKNPLRTEDDIFTVGIKQVCIERYKQIDLIPFLKEYGKNVEGIEMPELHPAFSKTARQGMKILDYTQPLDISLLENVKLTGIGWIDDQLHTQIHFTAEPIRTSDGIGHSGAGVNIHDSVSSEGVVWPLGWDDNGDEFPDWMESVIDVRQEDAEDLRLTAEVWENKEIVEDDWEVQIPLEEVLAEDEVTTE